MTEKKYKGVVVPLITPFTEEGKIDQGGVEKLFDHIITHHCDPFILGTTGEALSIPLAMKQDFIRMAVHAKGGRKTLYAGISSMCMEDSITLAKMFFDNGGDVVVAHLPGYYPLSEHAMLRYFEQLADRVNGPLMLYNIPSTTHHSIPVEVVKTLSAHPNIIGLKDSERNEERIHTLTSLFRDNGSFSYMLGWASMSMEFLRLGGDGIVPSSANAIPELYYNLYKATLAEETDTARKMQELTDQFSLIYQKDRLLSEAIPGLKVILDHLNICKPYVLPPCYVPDENEKERLIAAYKEFEKELL